MYKAAISWVKLSMVLAIDLCLTKDFEIGMGLWEFISYLMGRKHVLGHCYLFDKEF